MNMTRSMPRGRFLVKDQVPASSPCSPALLDREVVRSRRGGDARECSVMLISNVTPVGPPLTVTFIAPEKWTRVKMRLEEVRDSHAGDHRGAGVGGGGGAAAHHRTGTAWSSTPGDPSSP